MTEWVGGGASAGRRQRARAVILVERDEGEQSLGDALFGPSAIARRDHFDSYAHRGAPAPLEMRIDRDDVAQQDRRDELPCLDRHKLGRASCRDRVCEYSTTSGVPVS